MYNFNNAAILMPLCIIYIFIMYAVGPKALPLKDYLTSERPMKGRRYNAVISHIKSLDELYVQIVCYYYCTIESE